MIELIHQLTDDQMALVGCLGALGAGMALLSLSFHSNPANKPASSNNESPAVARQQSPNEEQRRRAA